MVENYFNFGNGTQIGNINGGLTINIPSDKSKSVNIKTTPKYPKSQSTSTDELCEHCIHADIKGPGTYTFGNSTMNVSDKMVTCKLKAHSISIIEDEIRCSEFEQK